MSTMPHPPLKNSSNWPIGIAGFPAGWNLASPGRAKVLLAGYADAGQNESRAETLRGDQGMKKIVALTLLFLANAVLALIDRRGRRSLEKRLAGSDELGSDELELDELETDEYVR
jgi:hypothetical protein